MSEEHWAKAMRVRRSPLDARVWVPLDVLDTPEAVYLHVGSFRAVRRWCEDLTHREGEETGNPVLKMRWVKESRDAYRLDVVEGP